MAAAMSTTSRRTPKLDAHLSNEDAIARARQALAEFTRPGDVGNYAGAQMLADRLANLRFECTMPGYRGWTWVVTVARFPRSRVATVDETELLPGPSAVLAPQWVPWAERLRPGDLGPGDMLPHVPDDPRLEPGYEQSDDDDGDRAAVIELGLGRARVLSATGRADAAGRWYAGPGGPDAPEALKAAEQCSTCGFATPLAGSLRQAFAVCANEWSASDGRVVSWDHGCGAHSETGILRSEADWPDNDPLIDDSVVVPLEDGSN
jgi:hypothetical protein